MHETDIGLLLRHLLGQTETPYALGRPGDFAAAFDCPHGHVLVASTDGVGSKTVLASALGRHAFIGQDLVAHCVNDVLAMGARPLVLLDYLGFRQLAAQVQRTILQSLADACQAHQVALIGGETSVMDLYGPGEYDLVGTCIGSVAPEALVDGRHVGAGDVVLGLPSSGLHTNGYTLARRVFAADDLTTWVKELDTMMGEALLRPHRCYLPDVEPLLDTGVINAMAHITGGGLPGNLARQLPEGLGVQLDSHAWEVPPLFRLLQQAGRVPTKEMWATCNMGIGFCLMTAPQAAAGVQDVLPEALVIGEVVPVDHGPRVLGLSV